MATIPLPAIIPNSENPLKSLTFKIKNAHDEVIAAENKALPIFI